MKFVSSSGDRIEVSNRRKRELCEPGLPFCASVMAVSLIINELLDSAQITK